MGDFVGEGFIPPVQFLAAANAPGGMNASPTNHGKCASALVGGGVPDAPWGSVHNYGRCFSTICIAFSTNMNKI